MAAGEFAVFFMIIMGILWLSSVFIDDKSTLSCCGGLFLIFLLGGILSSI
ncbi:MAG: hypothetical protein ACI4RQ_01075 [Methanobrevibacter wolinii]